MKDVEKIKIRVGNTSKQKSPDLSFLKSKSKATQSATQTDTMERPGRGFDFVFKKIILVLVLVGCGVIVGWVVHNQYGAIVNPLPPAPPVTDSLLLDPAAYYKVTMIDNVVYYAHASVVEHEHYLLTSLFYEPVVAETAAASIESATSTAAIAVAGGSADGEVRVDRLILIKYGTESDQPRDELLVPREKVKSISPLSNNSPILKAIGEYLRE
jgi:hypothetical protein